MNFLSHEQRRLSDFFASKAQDQFGAIDCSPGRNNAPIIQGAAAYLDCETISETTCGTHTIFLAHPNTSHAASD